MRPEVNRDKQRRVGRWVLAAALAHTAFVGAVLLVDYSSSIITLRKLHEQIVDRHAYEAWWWLQGRFPHEIGTLMYPVARLLGLEQTSTLMWAIWYITVGAFPYVLFAATVAALRRSR